MATASTPENWIADIACADGKISFAVKENTEKAEYSIPEGKFCLLGRTCIYRVVI